MKAEFENIAVTKNEESHRFELQINGYVAFIDYKETRSSIALIHTESPAELAGTGAASALVEKTLQYVEREGKQLLPYCPFVFKYIKKNTEWKRIVKPTFPGYDEL